MALGAFLSIRSKNREQPMNPEYDTRLAQMRNKEGGISPAEALPEHLQGKRDRFAVRLELGHMHEDFT